jgi:C1A family cysteine protease
MSPVRNQAGGWRLDLGDHRDYAFGQSSIEALLRILKIRKRREDLPAAVDWREYCGPIEDQGEFSTSTAHASVALLQQFERRASGRMLRLSRMFAHQCACRQEKVGCDSGISLRAMLKAMVRSGVPPEEYWPYDALHASREPDGFAYSFHRDFRTIRYLRLDPHDSVPDDTLERLKRVLAAGFPFVFGFPVCTSVGSAPEIPYPTAADSVLCGQAVVAVGYDDKLRVRSDKGALLVRNSWGADWGDGGFGWLPYNYVRRRLAADFWTLLKPSWLKSGEFESPQSG